MQMIKRALSSLLVFTLIIAFTGCTAAKPKAVKEPAAVVQNQAFDADKAKLEQQAKLESEAKKMAEEEAKAKTEAEAKAKADAEVKVKTQAAASALKPQSDRPSSTNPSTSSKGRPTLPTNYPVEYWTEVENEIVRLCNVERSKMGLPAFASNETLRQVARYKSNEMLQYNYFDHNSPITGYKPWDLAKTYGWSSSTFGENIWMTQGQGSGQEFGEWFKAQVTAQEIVTDWMNSPGHKANILNKSYSKIGVGVAFSNTGKAEATQEFSN